ncbi:MAG: DUF4238 domain-containing protein [Saprospiraceae bacterium]
MSTPTNHHYVSQCHQRGFFNDGTQLIYLYDKELNNFYPKKSTKTLFSEDHLNTRLENGSLDHSTLERELKILFEDDFVKHVSIIEKFLVLKERQEEAYEALCWLTMLGILGELRHPQYKKTLDRTLLKFQSEIFSRIHDFSPEEIVKHLSQKQKTPYSNYVDYASIALRILKKMEPLDFMIFSIESDDHFLLPDTSCFQLRGQLKNYADAGIQEIIQIGIPLTDKLFILATPQSLKTTLHGACIIQDNDSDCVNMINKDLYLFARKAVACKDDYYLHEIIKKIKNNYI